MKTKNRKIILELNEHDALQLLALIRRKINQENEIWQPYWERLAQSVEDSIERAGFGIFQHDSQAQDPFDKPQKF